MMILLCIHYQILAVGVEVQVENTKHKLRKGGKLEPAFLGPYTISRHVGKGVYELKKRKGELMKQKVNVNRLKLYKKRKNVSKFY